jgi:hypothetical protein
MVKWKLALVPATNRRFVVALVWSLHDELLNAGPPDIRELQ